MYILLDIYIVKIYRIDKWFYTFVVKLGLCSVFGRLRKALGLRGTNFEYS